MQNENEVAKNYTTKTKTSVRTAFGNVTDSI